MFSTYVSRIKQLIEAVEKEEGQNIENAAQKVAQSIMDGDIIHLFGCGHSHILTEEVFYRAGGLAPMSPILFEPLMLHKGAVTSSLLERQNDYAEAFMEKVHIEKGDTGIILSTSGRNPVPVDAALYMKDKGAYTIGITSRKYSSSQPSRHKNGLYLYNSVDLVVDNHAEVGDALLSHEKVPVAFAPGSTVIGALILNGILARAIEYMADSGFEPPVFLSGNLEKADERNNRLVEKYRDRIRLLS
jgi:uncharacterized phosphosugar-binding protein